MVFPWFFIPFPAVLIYFDGFRAEAMGSKGAELRGLQLLRRWFRYGRKRLAARRLFEVAVGGSERPWATADGRRGPQIGSSHGLWGLCRCREALGGAPQRGDHGGVAAARAPGR